MISPKTTSILSHLPSFYRSDDEGNVLYRLLEAYAAQLEGAENDLIRVMRSHWSDRADNEGSESPDARQKGDLDKIFALWLESLGGTALLRQTGRRPNGEGGEADDAAYRERIKALIGVIRRGASTVEGIRAVVAANLGIIGNDPAAKYARDQIRIEEYLPTANETLAPNLALYTPFSVVNPNPIHIPIGFSIKVTGDLPVPLVGLYMELPALRQTIGCPVSLIKNDVLYLFYDKTALLNGQAAPTFGTGIQLPRGESKLQAGAKLGYPQGRFDQSALDRATFNIELAEAMGRFDAPKEEGFDLATFALTDPVLEVKVLRYDISPGAFTVSLPWDSPGFTTAFQLPAEARIILEKNGFVPPPDLEQTTYERLADLTTADWFVAQNNLETRDAVLEKLAPLLLPGDDLFGLMETNPRAQIKPIVDRVRAAGVYALINYEKRFSESNDLSDLVMLSAKHRAIVEDIGMLPATHDKLSVLTLQKPDPETHDIGDGLTLSVMLDFTQFDSLNGFG